MSVVVRFAPSPTGRLHIGNVRAALVNALFARKHGGRLLLRLDDTDLERSSEAFAEAILTDLAWLGLSHDLFARQSDRFAHYESALERLKSGGHLYAAYETPDELERKRKRQLARGLPPVYDRAALALTAEDHARFAAEGRKPHWRFRLAQTTVVWADAVRGEVAIDTKTLSDPVLVREDGQYLYTLPSVADDIYFGITHVIRGEDHVVNTAVQIEIFRALGAPPPAFAHFPMIIGKDGEKLSKRLGSLSLESLRQSGIDPMAVWSLLAAIGTSDPVVALSSLDALAARFDLAKVSHAPARFDPADLRMLTARLLHQKPYADVAAALSGLGVGGGEVFWNAVRDNLNELSDAVPWWAVIANPLPPPAMDRKLTIKAAELLPHGALSEQSWGPWTKAVSEATGIKGKDLFQPLRLAITGAVSGPELKRLLPLIGRERVLARLQGIEA